MKNILLVISGPSGSGKNTLIDYLMEDHKELVHSVSATSRNPRPKEIDGVHYYFKTREEFEKMRDGGELLEWDEFRDNYYGTVIADIEKKLANGKNVAFDITVPGAENVRKKFGERAVTVFLIPPSVKVLKNRLVARNGEDLETIKRRIEFGIESELSQFTKFDYCIVNDDLEKAKKQILEIYNTETESPELTEEQRQGAEANLVVNNKDKISQKIAELKREAAED